MKNVSPKPVRLNLSDQPVFYGCKIQCAMFLLVSSGGQYYEGSLTFSDLMPVGSALLTKCSRPMFSVLSYRLLCIMKLKCQDVLGQLQVKNNYRGYRVEGEG